VDTRFDPIGSLLQYTEGKPWAVEYYQRVMGSSEEVMAQATNVAAPFQQYRRIRNMIVRVTEALSDSQDTTTKQMKTEGAGITFPSFIPNVGDMFLAPLLDGREGVFVITESEKKTHLKEAQYQVRWEMKGFSDTFGTTLADLAEKVIESFTYVADYLTFGRNPLLLDQKYAELMDIRTLRDELVDYFFTEAFSNEHQTLMVPNQEFTTYDPFLTKFVLDLIGSDEHPYVGRIRKPSVDQQLVGRHPTIWDSIRAVNHRTIRNNVHRVRLLDSGWFRSQPLYAGIYWTGIKRVVFPFHARTDVDAPYYPICDLPPLVGQVLMAAGKSRWNTLERLAGTPADGLTLPQLQESPEPPVGTDLPDYVRVTVDDFYVFSESFYTQLRPASKLESILLQYIKQQPIDTAVLSKLASAAPQWPNVERFYYLPVLLLLITAAIRGN